MTAPDAGETDATATLIAALIRAGRTVAAAESLTGGGLLAELTRPAGASAVVLGGAVVYATELKHSLAGVDADLLAERGPVDAEVARQLAAGVRERCRVGGRPADLGVSTTGVAGPDPQGGRSPGTVFVGFADAHRSTAVELTLTGGRAEIRRQTIEHAIAGLADFLARE